MGGELFEVDFGSDPAHCGRCDNACPEARGGRPRCEGGRCGSPCDRDANLCNGRCVYEGAYEALGNCGEGCCPVVQPGVVPGGALNPRQGWGWTIETDGPARIRARVRFEDGSCPEFDTFDTDNEGFNLTINTVDDNTNAPMIARERRAYGDGGWCGVAEAEVAGGPYEVVMVALQNLPAHEVEISILPAAQARAGNVLSQPGIYPAPIPEDGVASFTLQVDTTTRVVLQGMSTALNSDYPEGCLFGEINIGHPEGGLGFGSSDDQCPVLESVLVPGEYRVTLRRTFGDPDPRARLAFYSEPLEGRVAALPEEGPLVGGPVAALRADVYTFETAAAGERLFALSGAGCEAGDIAIWKAGSPWFEWATPGAGCPGLTTLLEPGTHRLYVFGHNLASLDAYTLDFAGPQGGDGLRDAGALRRPGFGQGAADEIQWTVSARANFEIFTGNGAGGCPGDTLLQISGNGVNVSDDDGGTGGCSRIARQFNAGVYQIRVSGYNGAAIPAYTLTVR